MRGQSTGGGDPLIGRVFGHHVLIELIGSGAFGRVYRARHRLLGRDRAIKVLLSEHASDDRLAQLFLREANLAAALNHPNVVVVHDVGEEDDLPYIVMELLHGEPLRSVLKQQTSLPVGRTLHLLQQLAAALDHAHAAGVVHRDVKPENAMIDAAGGLKLVDFGIGRAQQASQQTAFGAGTVSYMAPELIQAARAGQLSSFDLGVSSDRYALGVMAFELLTGRRPFVGPTRWDLEREHLTTDPPAPHTLRQDLTEGVDPVLLRQLAKDPAARYPTGAAFVEALRQSLTPPAPAPNAAPPRQAAPASDSSRLGPYLLTGLIGSGSLTAVYRADHQLLGVTRAVMVLHRSIASDGERRRHFTSVAALAMRLQHPNIVRVLDLAEANGTLYAPMELVEGSTLAEVSRTEGLLDLRRVERILAQVAEALDYAHARGVVHRDVRPANLIVGADDRVTLIDFSFAQEPGQAASADVPGAARSPAYLAPETWEQRGTTAASDGWALAVIAYELLTGRRPFERASTVETMRAVRTGVPTPPSQLRLTLPPAVDAVVLRQLSKTPFERFPHARAFVEALTAALGAPATAPDPSSEAAAPRLMFDVGLGTDDGRVLSGNQDAVICEAVRSPSAHGGGLIVALADGFGPGGEAASAMAVQVAANTYLASTSEPLDALHEAYNAASWAVDRAVRERAASDDAATPFGTTLTVLTIRGRAAIIAHVGNCRVLVVSRGSIMHLTRDHTWPAEEIAAGRLTTEAARTDPRRNVPTRVLGQRDPLTIDTHHGTVDPGDIFVVCSDGLHATVGDHEIMSHVLQSRPADAVADLTRLASGRRPADNISVVVIRVMDADGRSSAV